MSLASCPNLHRNSEGGVVRNWKRDSITTKEETELKSASNPLKTSGNCISANYKFKFFSEGREVPRFPAKCARTASWKASSKSGFSCIPNFQTPAPSLLIGTCAEDNTRISWLYSATKRWHRSVGLNRFISWQRPVDVLDRKVVQALFGRVNSITNVLIYCCIVVDLPSALWLQRSVIVTGSRRVIWTERTSDSIQPSKC